MGTIASLILVGLSVYASIDTMTSLFPYVAIAITVAFLLAFAIGNVVTATALQRAELQATSGIIGLFQRDWQVWLIHGFILSWSLLSLFLALTNPATLTIPSRWVISVWLVLSGIALDMATYLYHRVLQFLSPFSGLQLVQAEAVRDIQGGRDVELCSRIDSLAETGLKASRHDGLSLCRSSIDAIKTTVQQDLTYNRRQLQAAAPDSQPTQRASYLLNFAGERLALIYSAAHEKGLHSLCQDVISALGKIAVSAGDMDPRLVAGPITFMGNLTKQAVKAQNQGAGVKMLLTLVQVSKRILSDQDQSKASLEKAFTPIVKQMDEVAKECFRQDKNIPLPTLTAPFQELKRIFEHERLATHPDQPAILALIDRTLTDFANVELVLRTLPPLPNITSDEDELPNPT